MSVTALFTNPGVVQTLGLSGIMQGLAPTRELGEVVDGLEHALLEAAPHFQPKFAASATRLRNLLASGGSPTNFASAQERLAAILAKLNAKQIDALIKATGWEQSGKRFVSEDPSIDAETINRAMDRFDATMGLYLRSIANFVRLPSISAPDYPEKNLFKSAEWAARKLREVGFKVKILKEEGAHPSVYGEIMVDPNAPTVILYSHHDVQPAEEKDWKTDPFNTIVKQDRMYGRGAADDKAGFMANLAAVDCLRKAGKLRCNVIFFVEGEEEIGSPHLATLLRKMRPDIKADVALLTDAANVESGLPTDTTSTRGLHRLLVRVETAEHELHAGLWGGAVPDAYMALSHILSTLQHPNGAPRLDALKPPVMSEEVRKAVATVPFDEAGFRKAGGLKLNVPIWGDPDLSVNARLWRGYVLNVLAIEGPQTKIKKASGKIVPWAEALLELRVPPGGEVNEAAKQVEEAILGLREKMPWFDIKVSYPKAPIEPWEADLKHPIVGTLAKALSVGYGRETVFAGCGGGIGFLFAFNELFPGVPLIPIGIEDPDTRAHSANESLNIADFGGATRGLIAFLGMLGASVKRQ